MSEREISAERKLASLEEQRQINETDCLNEHSLFLLDKLVNIPDSISYEEIGRSFSSTENGKYKPKGYNYWLGLAKLMRANFVHDLGDSVVISQLGIKFYTDFENRIKEKQEQAE